MQATETAPTNLITFTCPYCEHKVEASDAKDGDVLTCTNPLCLKQFQAELPKVQPDPELILPAHLSDFEHEPIIEQTAAEAPANPAEGEAPTTGTTIAAPEAPQVVAVYKPPMLSRHPVRFLINVGLVLIGLAGLAWSYLLGSEVLAAFSFVPLVYGLVRQFVWWLRARHMSLTITTRGIVITEGTWTMTSREIYHDAIHGIHIFQPWWARLLNTGALMFTFGDKDEQLYLDSMPAPQKIAEQIREHAKK